MFARHKFVIHAIPRGYKGSETEQMNTESNLMAEQKEKPNSIVYSIQDRQMPNKIKDETIESRSLELHLQPC